MTTTSKKSLKTEIVLSSIVICCLIFSEVQAMVVYGVNDWTVLFTIVVVWSFCINVTVLRNSLRRLREATSR